MLNIDKSRVTNIMNPHVPISHFQQLSPPGQSNPYNHLFHPYYFEANLRHPIISSIIFKFYIYKRYSLKHNHNTIVTSKKYNSLISNILVFEFHIAVG